MVLGAVAIVATTYSGKGRLEGDWVGVNGADWQSRERNQGGFIRESDDRQKGTSEKKNNISGGK